MKNNSRFGVWVLIPGFVLAFAARMVQLCAGTDMTSGFLKHDNGFFMNACFWAAVIISIGGAVAAAVFDRKRGSAFYQTPVSGVTDGRAAAVGFAMLLPAMGALYEGYSEMRIPEESNISPSPFMVWVDFIFGAAMLVVAFLILYYKEFKPGLGFATVSGAAFYTLRKRGEAHPGSARGIRNGGSGHDTRQQYRRTCRNALRTGGNRVQDSAQLL